MKIDDQIFSYPPYLSTTWNQIAALHLEETTLVITLFDEKTVRIPEVPEVVLKLIFEAHRRFLEGAHREEFALKEEGVVQFGFGPAPAWGTALEHNPEQSEMPDLPNELLEKIRGITKVLGPSDPDAAPEPEPGCNCLHCQIAGAIRQGMETEGSGEFLQSIPEQELPFEQWEIRETSEAKVYLVINRLNQAEQYSVYLGNPVGCTCGMHGCEHVVAVLKS